MLTQSELLTHVWRVYDAGGLITTCARCSGVLVDGEWAGSGARALTIIEVGMATRQSLCPDCEGYGVTDGGARLRVGSSGSTRRAA